MVQVMRLFVTPSLAVARLGSSTTPVEAYAWVDGKVARDDGETTISPRWTLAVEPDGSLRPYMPEEIAFRDGDRIRPVAPFFEVWASLGEEGSEPDTWTETPVTAQMLNSHGHALDDLQLSVSAANRKAARRTGNASLVFGTESPMLISGTDHRRHAIEGTSPASTHTMIPFGRHIPLGHIQMIRTAEQVPGQPWSDAVNLETVRFRLWPAEGKFFGPPQAAETRAELGRTSPAVPQDNAFLDDQAGWYGAASLPGIAPRDTYDVVNQITGSMGASLGVVDDTCEVHFELRLLGEAGRQVQVARAVAFVAPPHFAPDRRPFLSVADEINDRSGDAQARNEAMSETELDDWIEDFFERVYETVSLLNVDNFRSRRSIEIPEEELEPDDIDLGQRNNPNFAMGGRDALRNRELRIGGGTEVQPLPLSLHARTRHRQLSDLQKLGEFVASNPERMGKLVREPFFVGPQENWGRTSMQMPPFMRQSNAQPLTVAAWQYDLIMRWVDKSTRATILAASTPPKKTLSESAARRKAAVLASLDLAGR